MKKKKIKSQLSTKKGLSLSPINFTQTDQCIMIRSCGCNPFAQAKAIKKQA